MLCFRSWLVGLALFASALGYAQFTLDWTVDFPHAEVPQTTQDTFGLDGSIYYLATQEPLYKIDITRLSPSGAVIYHKVIDYLPGAGRERFDTSVIGDKDGNAFVINQIQSLTFPYPHFMTIYKLGPLGAILWQKDYADITAQSEQVHNPSGLKMAISHDGNLFIRDDDVYWIMSADGSAPYHDKLTYWTDPHWVMSDTEDAAYVNKLTSFDRYVAKITPAGIEWERRPFPNQPALGIAVVLKDIKVGPDHNIYMLGYDPQVSMGGEHVLYVMTPDGVVLKLNSWFVPYEDVEIPSSMALRQDGSILLEEYDPTNHRTLMSELNANGMFTHVEYVPDLHDNNSYFRIGNIVWQDSVERVFLAVDEFAVGFMQYIFNRDRTHGPTVVSPWASQPPGTSRLADWADASGRLLVRYYDASPNTHLQVYSPAGGPRPDAYNCAEAGNLVRTAANGVKANDSGAAGMTCELVDLPQKGTVNLQPDGGFTYHSTGGFGFDTFTYRLVNGSYRSRKETVTINLIAVLPRELTTNKLSMYGGQSATLTVKMDRPAPDNGAVVQITSTSFVVPATVTVPAGATQVQFAAVAKPQRQDVTGNVHATRSTKSVSIQMAILATKLAALATNKSTLKGGTSFLLYVGLTGTAPAPGITVWLSSNQSVVPVPANVLVAENTTLKSVTILTLATATTKVATISGNHNGVVKTVSVTVTP